MKRWMTWIRFSFHFCYAKIYSKQREKNNRLSWSIEMYVRWEVGRWFAAVENDRVFTRLNCKIHQFNVNIHTKKTERHVEDRNMRKWNRNWHFVMMCEMMYESEHLVIRWSNIFVWCDWNDALATESQF